MIFDEQNAKRPPPTGRRLLGLRDLRDLCTFDRRQRDIERASLSEAGAPSVDGSAVRADDALAEHQAESEA